MVSFLRKTGVLLSLIVLISCAPALRGGEREVSEDAYLYYILAAEAEMDANWEEALRNLRLALREDPESAYLKTEISKVYSSMGEME